MRRGAAFLGAAAAASLFLGTFLSLPRQDPFWGTVVLLPWVIAALSLIERAAVGHSTGTPPARLAPFGEKLALGLLFLVLLARGALGLGPASHVDPLLAAAFLLLLAHHLGRMLPLLRRALGARLSERPPWLFFALPLTVYLALLPWSAGQRPPDGDEPYYLLTTHSLAYDLDADLANNYAAGDSQRFMERRLEPQPGDPVGARGERYSRHNVLLPLILAPAYRLAGTPGALVIMTLFAAALAWMILRLAQLYTPDRPGAALAAYAITAFTAPLLLYSYQVWVEVPGALLLTVALDQILRLGSETPSQSRRWLIATTALLLLPLLKIRFAAVAAPLLVLALWRSAPSNRRRVLLMAVALAAVVGAVLLYNQWAYGNPFKYHTLQGPGPYARHPGLYARGLLGLLFDCAFGLFANAPAWILLLPAGLLLAVRRHRLAVDFAVIYLPYLVLLGPRDEWFGAWSPPFRYGVILLPLLATALVPLLGRRTRGGTRLLWAVLGALTLVLTVLWIALPGWTYNLADGRSRLLDYLSTQLGADVARWFPSSIRPRAASWVWPPLATLLVTLFWWYPRRRLRHAGTLGSVALLLAGAGMVLASHRVPTKVLEFEDPFIVKTGGQLHPGVWVVNRPSFHGGWWLPAGARLSAPLVAGGPRVSLWLHYRSPGKQAPPTVLEVRAGQRVLARQRMRPDDRWKILEIELRSWPPGSPMTLALESSVPRPPRTRIILDRARLGWRQE